METTIMGYIVLYRDNAKKKMEAIIMGYVGSYRVI